MANVDLGSCCTAGIIGDAGLGAILLMVLLELGDGAGVSSLSTSIPAGEVWGLLSSRFVAGGCEAWAVWLWVYARARAVSSWVVL